MQRIKAAHALLEGPRCAALSLGDDKLGPACIAPTYGWMGDVRYTHGTDLFPFRENGTYLVRVNGVGSRPTMP